VRNFHPDRLFFLALASGALAVIGFVLGVHVLAGAGVAAVVGAGLVFVWQRQCLEGVGYERRLDRHRALFGEEVGLTVTVDNHKVLPLTWLRVEDNLSSELTIRGGTVATSAQSGRLPELVQLMAIMPFQRVEREMTIVCDRRGRHAFGPVRLESGDPFGYRTQVRRLQLPDELLVYPKTFAMEPAALVSRLALGPARAGPLVMADPSRIVGSREYQPGDPLRHVDWRGTARRGTPMVRVFQPTATPRVVVVLDTRLRVLSDQQELFEFVVAVAASAVLEMASRRIGVGLVSTGSVNGRPVAISPSTSPDTPTRILETLACLSPFGLRSPEAVADAVARSAGPGTTLLAVGGAFPQDLLLGLGEARRRGAPVTGLHVGTGDTPAIPGRVFDDLFQTDMPDDWRTRGTIHLVH
jgi:uncharacterized protein (DUF58 family)